MVGFFPIKLAALQRRTGARRGLRGLSPPRSEHHPQKEHPHETDPLFRRRRDSRVRHRDRRPCRRLHQPAAAQRASRPALDDSRAYLAALPDSEQAARELLAWARGATGHLAGGRTADARARCKLHAPVEVAALFDFGLTPRHLANSVDTMARYEKDNPQTAALLEAFAKMLLNKPPAATPPGVAGAAVVLQVQHELDQRRRCDAFPGRSTPRAWTSSPSWPWSTAMPAQPVAGYCIFNDVSARDVQAPEIIGGFCLTKDMAQGNQLGPLAGHGGRGRRPVRAGGHRRRSMAASAIAARPPRSATRRKT